MKKRVLGIVLLVLGVMSVFGSIINGSFAGYADGIGVAEITTITLEIAMIVYGIVLIIKGEK